jgi:hypothetical protein
VSVRLHRALIFAIGITPAIAGRAQVVTTQLVPTKTFKVPWASAMEILPFKCDTDGNIYGRFGTDTHEVFRSSPDGASRVIFSFDAVSALKNGYIASFSPAAVGNDLDMLVQVGPLQGTIVTFPGMDNCRAMLTSLTKNQSTLLN